MVIRTRAKLRKISTKYPLARKAVEAWAEIMERISPRHLMDLRKTFPTADAVGENKTRICFNIKGNEFRLITKVNYETQDVLIVEFLKHQEYERKYPH